MNADQRVESPIPILPLSTPDAETEKLIKMKDEEVSRASTGVRARVWHAWRLPLCAAEEDAADAPEDAAADARAGPVTRLRSHKPTDDGMLSFLRSL